MAKAAFGRVPEICWNTIIRFYISLDHHEMSWDLVLLAS